MAKAYKKKVGRLHTIYYTYITYDLSNIPVSLDKNLDTPPKTNTSPPEKGWLQDEIPFWTGPELFQGLY